MDEKEKEVLRKIYEFPKGLLSQSDLLQISLNDTKTNHFLITSGYLEETKRKKKGIRLGFQEEVTFYRITEKGRRFFDPPYKKFWFSVKGDMRTIILAFITIVITLIINRLFS